MMTGIASPLSEEQLKQALDSCAQEPIHIPGSIQPFGFLLVLSHKNMIIEQMSSNFATELNLTIADYLGKPVTALIGEAQKEIIERNSTAYSPDPQHTAILSISDKQFDITAHHAQDSIHVELEPLGRYNNDYFHDELRSYSIGMYNARNLQDLFDHVTDSIKHITKFHRVKLYRFDADWNGEVVAESRDNFITSYKGLHFPASDIPEQARRLYTKNYIRLIADTHYRPVGLEPALHPVAKAPLDMTYVGLRSVSPIHIQYLENMGVRASMSVSIIQNGKLWGLIACHHNNPHYIPTRVRRICEIMGHIFSAQLTGMEQLDAREEESRRADLINKLSSAIERHKDFETLMTDRISLLMEAMQADSVAILTSDNQVTHGAVPSAPALKALIEWAAAQQSPLLHAVEINQLGLPHCDGIEGGVFALRLDKTKNDFILWFRQPILKNVQWAGNPEKTAEETKAGWRLTPRASFSLWKESVQTKCKAWDQKDIDTAQSILTIAVEQSASKAHEANRAKSEFLANMSHELRTPMNAIIGIINIFQRDKTLTGKYQEYIKALHLSASSLLNLLNDLLDISKIEASGMALEEVPFDLPQLLVDIKKISETRASEKKLDLIVSVPELYIPTFIGDAHRLQQVLLNLISNAIKFTERGFVHVLTHVKATPDGLYGITFEVADSGIGIAPANLTHIFDKFVQADQSVSRRFGGTGLGLAISQAFVQLMGGTITVASQEGMGSKFSFTVTLPATMDGVTPSLAPAEMPIVQRKSDGLKHILLAEDYEGNILVAQTLLELLGYQVSIARDGGSAVEMVQQQAYDLILMDVQMPVMNGYEATQKIRALQQSGKIPATPIIGMTAHALQGDREKCLECGMEGYISKPFDPSALDQLLREKLGESA